MTPKLLLPGLAALLLGASSCATIEAGSSGEPWESFGKGTTTVGVSTGWAFYGASAEAAGQTGVLEGDEGSDTTTLTPNYGGALSVRHMVTDHLSLGGIFEVRSFDPDSLSPLSAELEADDFETYHYILSSRYFFDGMGESGRWRPFVGLDLSYIPDVDLGEVTVTYPASSGLPQESVGVVGSDYWALAGVLGMSYQINDDWSFDTGAFYEYALTTSDASIEFQSLAGAQADMALRPEGLVLFGGLTFGF
ncbi:MAG: outer membrane protein W [Candidatus Paceibacteria bacterium]|jgi:outer membrane protein W